MVRGKAWSPETRHSYYTSFGLFFAHVTRSRDDAENPAAALPSVRRPPTLPRPAPDPIVNSAVVEAAPRTALILALAAELGLRAHEVAKVHKDDIHHDLFGLALTVRGKGGKDRTIPLSTGLGTRILAACRATPSGFAFPGQIDGHLSARWVSKLASHVLPKPWTLHTLRHRFATVAYAAERDLVAVQQLMGHASVATTQRYAAAPTQALRNAVTAIIDTVISSGTTALLVHSDPEAIGIVEHALARGLSVPDDLSVIAYDDEVAQLFNPALTAVSPARANIGRAAVDLLLRRVSEPERPLHRIILSPRLNVRESTAPAPVAMPR